MEIKLSNANPLKIKTHCLILPVSNQKKLTGVAAEADKASDKYLSKILKQGDLNDKAGATVMLHDVAEIAAQRVLLVSTGSVKTINAEDFDKMSTAVAAALAAPGIKDCVNCMSHVDVTDKDQTWQARSISAVMNTFNTVSIEGNPT